MPPREKPRQESPGPLALMLEEVRRLDPTIDLSPGTNVRLLIEAAARGYSGEVPPLAHLGASIADVVREPITQIANVMSGLMSTVHDASLLEIARITEPFTWRRPVGFNPATLPSGVLPASTRNEVVAAQDRASQSIRDEEDRRIFEVLDSLARDGTFAHTFGDFHSWDLPRASGDFHMYEEPGDAVINLGARRVEMPLFEISSTPTVRFDDIRMRRFSSNPCGEVDLGGPMPCGEVDLGGPMTLEQMKKVAAIVRPTAWERIVNGLFEELDYDGVA